MEIYCPSCGVSKGTPPYCCLICQVTVVSVVCSWRLPSEVRRRREEDPERRALSNAA